MCFTFISFLIPRSVPKIWQLVLNGSTAKALPIEAPKSNVQIFC